MTSPTEICQNGLLELGDEYQIDDIDEDSVEAQACAQIYDRERQALLRARDWNFAKVYTNLSTYASYDAANAPTNNWQYAYGWPGQCLRLRRLVNPMGRRRKPVPFETARSTDGDKIILTDLDDAVAELTTDLSDLDDVPISWQMALSMRIGAAVAIPLTSSQELREHCLQMAQVYMSQAALEDFSEEVEDDEDYPVDWITARE